MSVCVSYSSTNVIRTNYIRHDVIITWHQGQWQDSDPSKVAHPWCNTVFSFNRA